MAESCPHYDTIYTALPYFNRVLCFPELWINIVIQVAIGDIGHNHS